MQRKCILDSLAMAKDVSQRFCQISSARDSFFFLTRVIFFSQHEEILYHLALMVQYFCMLSDWVTVKVII